MITPYKWERLADVGRESWKCGYCDHVVAGDQGYHTSGTGTFARPCPECGGLTTFANGQVLPGPTPGAPVSGASPDVDALYEEARKAARAGAFTAAVMACRKILMNIAVNEGAKEGESFKSYIEFLENAGMFSPKAKTFVQYIKDLGNEANHQIKPMGNDDAEAVAVIEFVGSLLRHNYETPSKVPAKAVAVTQPTTSI